jgi:hypothetical protein
MMTGTLKIMDRKGHTTLEWSTDLRDTVEAANRKFDEMVAQGYTAFLMYDPTSGEKMTEFNENAESIVMIPRMVGG